jgi:putative endonuclease
LASKRNGTLYVGFTSALTQRIEQHKQGTIDSFSKKYNVNRLVWYEETTDVNSAIQKEKQMKKWKRQWKIDLIEKNNPTWREGVYHFFCKSILTDLSR